MIVNLEQVFLFTTQQARILSSKEYVTTSLGNKDLLSHFKVCGYKTKNILKSWFIIITHSKAYVSMSPKNCSNIIRVFTKYIKVFAWLCKLVAIVFYFFS